MPFVTQTALQVTKINKGLPGFPPEVTFEQDIPVIADSVRDLYVDPTNGSDTNDGLTTSTPLQSLQLAINMFKNPMRGVPTWAVNEDRTIHVRGASGTTMTASVVIPPHAGLGALIIEGQETTEQAGLTMTGTPFSTLAGYQIDQTLNLSGAGLTANTYQYNAFVVPQSSAAETQFDAGYDGLPIRDNGVNDLTVTAYDPGTWSAFSYAAAGLVDIVSPNITWRPADATAFSFVCSPAITNLGGALIVRGFNINPAAVGGTYGAFISNFGSGSPEANNTTALQRVLCTDPSFARFAVGSKVSFMGFIIDAPSNFVVMGACDMIIANMLSRCGFIDFDGPQSTAIYGASTDASSNAVGGFSFRGGFQAAGQVSVDVRASGTADAQIRVLGGSTVTFGPVSVEQAGSLNAIQVENSNVDLKIGANAGRLTGSTGNNGVGLDLSENSWGTAANEANITLTGAGGDMTVGANLARLWTAGAETDTVELSRYST